MTSLETKYMGLKLKNPIIVASSGLTNSIERIINLEIAGAGAIVLKSIFEEQINNEVSHLINRDPQNLYPEAEDYIWNYTRNNSITRHLNLLSAAKKRNRNTHHCQHQLYYCCRVDRLCQRFRECGRRCP